MGPSGQSCPPLPMAAPLMSSRALAPPQLCRVLDGTPQGLRFFARSETLYRFVAVAPGNRPRAFRRATVGHDSVQADISNPFAEWPEGADRITESGGQATRSRQHLMRCVELSRHRRYMR